MTKEEVKMGHVYLSDSGDMEIVNNLVDEVNSKINKLCDGYEVQLKAKDEKIKNMENILKKIICVSKNEDIIDIKHIHKNSFGYVMEYYSCYHGRNNTLILFDVLNILKNNAMLKDN